jgi:hypothetical protein
MDECIHGFDAGTCATCDVVLPSGVKKMVWVTDGGSKFHNDEDCPSLEYGQQEVADRLGNVSVRRQVKWAEAQQTRARCLTCVPHYR